MDRHILNESKIETIPKTMERFFGCSGKMLKPSIDDVIAVVEKIPRGKVITLARLREVLATKYKVQATCPAKTTKVLQLLSKEEKPICYWRVIKNNGELISKYPQGVDGHALLLQEEGFEVDFSKKNPVVVGYSEFLDHG